MESMYNSQGLLNFRFWSTWINIFFFAQTEKLKRACRRCMRNEGKCRKNHYLLSDYLNQENQEIIFYEWQPMFFEIFEANLKEEELHSYISATELCTFLKNRTSILGYLDFLVMIFLVLLKNHWIKHWNNNIMIYVKDMEVY